MRYLELKLISKSCSNLTIKVSFPSPLFVLFTDKFKESFVKLNLTPSFLSNETDATRSTESKKSLRFISSFFLIIFRNYLNIIWKFTINQF